MNASFLKLCLDIFESELNIIIIKNKKIMLKEMIESLALLPGLSQKE